MKDTEYTYDHTRLLKRKSPTWHEAQLLVDTVVEPCPFQHQDHTCECAACVAAEGFIALVIGMRSSGDYDMRNVVFLLVYIAINELQRRYKDAWYRVSPVVLAETLGTVLGPVPKRGLRVDLERWVHSVDLYEAVKGDEPVDREMLEFVESVCKRLGQLAAAEEARDLQNAGLAASMDEHRNRFDKPDPVNRRQRRRV